ncbi:hypothetical protein PHLGIDRAFT_18962 [Phlebiopsis gigantea 11061_1 CR5-6]|uniref:Uncharacterized protein n=1 Tax=Phlebiopsis gigantea (strain 11061_1 CR5-6) TaxID=745531 RepID=A0A0C3SBU0_PHLG1|nr:hypothetical protein PHLGIDRAFT_18962 [Phlebiopsis gigantea 11061_1 CR5-6]
MHQRPASAASVRPSSAASNRQQDQLNSTFTAFGDGIHIHSTPQPGDIPASGVHTPRVQPFTTNLGIPDLFVQGVPQNIAEALNRATTGMTSSGEYTTTTTTTTSRSTTPQLPTVRPVPVNTASSGARAFRRESFMQTSGGMGGEMGGSMIGEVFSDHDLAARFGALGVRPGRTRTVFSSTVSGGTTTSRASVSSREHFVASGLGHFQR